MLVVHASTLNKTYLFIVFFYLSLGRLAIIVCVCPSMKFMFLGYFIPFENRVAVVLLYIVFSK